MTKMAILNVENNEEWKKLGGRLLTPVHDELVCEIPAEYAERGAELLSQLMCEAGNFMPFEIKCDVETTYRWYGLEYPCPYKKPEDLRDESEESVKWIQYHLLEMEYPLPVFNEPDGSKPRGNAAKGINGIVSDQYKQDIQDYLRKYKLSEANFLNHIELKVSEGI